MLTKIHVHGIEAYYTNSIQAQISVEMYGYKIPLCFSVWEINSDKQ